jgi:2-hydroxychromene-2-carboxylate isomerase
MSTERAPIRFFFDIISPYAYLAWTQIHALSGRHGRRVLPNAVLFAALLNAHGQKGPAEIPPKRVYIFKDVVRRARKLGVPLTPPTTHPFNPLLALRVTTLPMEEDARRALIDALFRVTWGRAEGGERAGSVEDPVFVAAIAREAGLDGERLVAEAALPDAKARLRRQTEEALALGAFGVPTIVVDGELFWGVDSLGFIDDHLRGDDPVRPELLERWSHIKASASRTA